VERVLTGVIGRGWAESDEEAMRLQVAISPRVEARLDEMLGHPEICPHGNPIDAATAKRRPRGIRLSDMEAGTQATVFRITEEAEEDAGLLSYLEARALKPGAPITILARSESLDSLTLDGPRGRATLGLRPAALIRVLPGEADPGLFHTVPERGPASGSPPARPGRCTSARRGRLSTTSCRRATPAAPSSCASRTPIGCAARSSSRRTSSTVSIGSGSPGPQGRGRR